MMKLLLKYSFVLLSLILSACINLKPLNVHETHTYTLTATANPSKVSTIPYTLLITIPKANPGYTSKRMVYIEKPYQINYFAYHQWVNSPANMMLPLMVQTLQKGERFQAIVATPYAGKINLRLDTQIFALHQNFITQPSTVNLTVRAQLIDTQTGNILATRLFTVVEPTSANNPYSGVNATNEAMIKFLEKLNQFCIENTENYVNNRGYL